MGFIHQNWKLNKILYISGNINNTKKARLHFENARNIVVIVSRIIHVKVGWRLNVTNKFQDQRRLSSLLGTVRFRGTPFSWGKWSSPPHHSGVLGGQPKRVYSISLFHKPLKFMSNKSCPFKIFLSREVFKLSNCYVLVKNVDWKSAIPLKTLKMGFLNTLLWLNQGFGVLPTPLNLFYMAVRIYLYPETIVFSCTFSIEYMFFFRNIRCNKDDIQITCGFTGSIQR